MKTLELVEPETDDMKGQSVIHLPYGLLGFEQVKEYVLLANPEEEPFMWFQMVGNAKHSFLVLSPSRVVADYRPDISDDDVEFLDLTSPADAMILNIVTLRNDGQTTINLKGPIVINRKTLVGKQVIPNNATEYALRHPLPVA